MTTTGPSTHQSITPRHIVRRNPKCATRTNQALFQSHMHDVLLTIYKHIKGLRPYVHSYYFPPIYKPTGSRIACNDQSIHPIYVLNHDRSLWSCVNSHTAAPPSFILAFLPRIASPGMIWFQDNLYSPRNAYTKLMALVRVLLTSILPLIHARLVLTPPLLIILSGG